MVVEPVLGVHRGVVSGLVVFNPTMTHLLVRSAHVVVYPVLGVHGGMVGRTVLSEGARAYADDAHAKQSEGK